MVVDRWLVRAVVVVFVATAAVALVAVLTGMLGMVIRSDELRHCDQLYRDAPYTVLRCKDGR